METPHKITDFDRWQAIRRCCREEPSRMKRVIDYLKKEAIITQNMARYQELGPTQTNCMDILLESTPFAVVYQYLYDIPSSQTRKKLEAPAGKATVSKAPVGTVSKARKKLQAPDDSLEKLNKSIDQL